VNQQTILIISTNQTQARFMADCLGKAGFQIWMADQEETVIPALAQNPPSLVILNWGVLHSKELQWIRSMKANEKINQVPILVMGVEMAEEDVLDVLEAGADICVNDRLHPRVLVARVQALLRRKHSPEAR
jgi:two-component system phosphate regulon response regulator PhoB